MLSDEILPKFRVTGTCYILTEYQNFMWLTQGEQTHYSIYPIAYTVKLGMMTKQKTLPPLAMLQAQSYCAYQATQDFTRYGKSHWFNSWMKFLRPILAKLHQNAFDAATRSNDA